MRPEVATAGQSGPPPFDSLRSLTACYKKKATPPVFGASSFLWDEQKLNSQPEADSPPAESGAFSVTSRHAFGRDPVEFRPGLVEGFGGPPVLRSFDSRVANSLELAQDRILSDIGATLKWSRRIRLSLDSLTAFARLRSLTACYPAKEQRDVPLLDIAYWRDSQSGTKNAQALKKNPRLTYLVPGRRAGMMPPGGDLYFTQWMHFEPRTMMLKKRRESIHSSTS